MPQENQTQDEFLKDLNPEQTLNALDQQATPEGEQPAGGEADPTPEELSNRRERRLQVKLQAERESSIALAARLEALTEAQKARGETEEGAYLKSVEKIYGTQSPEAIEATELLKNAIKGAEERATERALEAFREEQRLERESVSKEEKALDSMVEELEDEFGVTIDPQTERVFFQQLEKMSSKDSEGNITQYADHYAVWEDLQSRRTTQPKVNRAKDLASRSMVRTGASPNSTVEAEANERWLIENGII